MCMFFWLRWGSHSPRYRGCRLPNASRSGRVDGSLSLLPLASKASMITCPASAIVLCTGQRLLYWASCTKENPPVAVPRCKYRASPRAKFWWRSESTCMILAMNLDHYIVEWFDPGTGLGLPHFPKARPVPKYEILRARPNWFRSS